MVSSADLVDLYSALAEEIDPFEIADTHAGKLRRTYVEKDADKRLNTLDALWTGDLRRRDGYASSILTSRAAARIDPDTDLMEHAGITSPPMHLYRRELHAEPR